MIDKTSKAHSLIMGAIHSKQGRTL